jgi:hypothetical protein
MSKARDLADGTFDTDTFVVDAANNRVGVGTSSPSVPFHVSSSNGAIARFANNSATLTTSYFTVINANNTSNGTVIAHLSDGTSYIGNQQNNSLKLVTNDTERMRIDSSGNLQLTSVDQDIEFNATTTAHESRLKWNYGGTLQSWIEREHSDGSMVFGNQGSERMTIDSNGRVTMPYQPSIYRYQNTTSQTVAAAVDTQVNFDTNGFAVGITYSSGNFSVPAAGKYFVSAIIRFNNHPQMPIQIAIKHNGNTKIYKYIQTSSNAYHAMNASVLLDMAASDSFSVYAYQASGSTQTISGNSQGVTSVSACKVS